MLLFITFNTVRTSYTTIDSNLRSLSQVDDDLNIYYQTIINNIYGNVIAPYLKQDLLAGIYQCSYAAVSLPGTPHAQNICQVRVS